MANNNLRGNEDAGKMDCDRGSIGKGLVIVVLALTAVLVYLYLFTGLIRPRENEDSVPKQLAEAVKRPLPPRPGQEAFGLASSAKPEEPPAAEAKAVKAPEPSPSAVNSAPKPTPPGAAKPSAVAEKATPPTAAAKPPAQAVRNDQGPAKAKSPQKPQPAATAKPVAVSASEKKPTSASSAAAAKVKPAKTVPAKAAVKQAKVEPVPAVKGRYILAVGGLASEREVRNARAALEKQGISPVTSHKVKKTGIMHRLFLSDYPDRGTAEAESQRLHLLAEGSFVINESGRYAVYAGSFIHEKGALSEQKRLASKGVRLVIRKTELSIPVTELSAGAFPSAEEARMKATLLKSKGIAARVVKSAPEKGD